MIQDISIDNEDMGFEKIADDSIVFACANPIPEIGPWGKTTWETTDILQKRHGKQISVADELLAHGPYSEWNGPPLWSPDRYPHGGARA